MNAFYQGRKEVTGRTAARIRSFLYAHTSNIVSLGGRDLGSIFFTHGKQRETDIGVNVPAGRELMSAYPEATGTAICDGVPYHLFHTTLL